MDAKVNVKSGLNKSSPDLQSAYLRFKLLLTFRFRNEIDLDVGIRYTADVHGRKVCRLHDLHDQRLGVEVVFELVLKLTLSYKRALFQIPDCFKYPMIALNIPDFYLHTETNPI